MKYLNAIKYLLAVTAVILIFIDWMVAIAVFILASIIHTVPLGPKMLLNTITGYLVIGGVIYLFFDWRIGLALIVGGLLVSKFHAWGNKKNDEYYSQQLEETENGKQ